MHGVPEGLQAEGAAHAALRHSFRREEARLHGVREGLLQERPPEETHEVAHRPQGQGGVVPAELQRARQHAESGVEFRWRQRSRH